MEEAREHLERGSRRADEVQRWHQTGNGVSEAEAHFRRPAPEPPLVIVMFVGITHSEWNRLDDGKYHLFRRRHQTPFLQLEL